MTGAHLEIPGWAVVPLLVCALAASAVLGACLDRRWRRRPGRDRSPLRADVREERLRLAAELHQVVSHEMSAVLLYSAGARAVPSCGDRRVTDALDLITQASTACMHELVRQRDVLRHLGGTSPAGVDGNDLDDLVRRARDRGVQVRLRSTGRSGLLDPSIEHTAHLVVDAALPQTQPVRGQRPELDLCWRPHRLELRLRVPGGLPPAWIRAQDVLADRAHLLGGELRTRTHGGRGLVTLLLPARPAAPARTAQPLSPQRATGHTGT